MKLVDTIKALYGVLFVFEGDPAAVFGEFEEIAVNELKHSISLSLKYHRIKHLPMLSKSVYLFIGSESVYTSITN